MILLPFPMGILIRIVTLWVYLKRTREPKKVAVSCIMLMPKYNRPDRDIRLATGMPCLSSIDSNQFQIGLIHLDCDRALDHVDRENATAGFLSPHNDTFQSL